jgi:hypothetical protein
MESVTDRNDCLNLGGEWANADQNFDTSLNSYVTLLSMATTEGWIGVMWNSVDAVGRER